MRLRLSTNFDHFPLVRQTPNESGVWAEAAFAINKNLRECDGWAVIEDVPEAEEALCPLENTLFITAEPPSVRRYHPAFLAQFAAVLTCERDDLSHPDLIFGQQGLPWHLGIIMRNGGWQTEVVQNYDALKGQTAPPRKTRLLSVVSSNKTVTEGHRRRLAFVRRLQTHFGDRIDVFGRGLREIEDKTEAISAYKYHIALENSVTPHYWTEKLADAYLGGAFPFYVGCPNVGDYFPSDSFLRLDMDAPERAIEQIEAAVEAERYENSLASLEIARTLVLDRYNLFALLTERLGPAANASKTRVRIRPQRHFEPAPGLLHRIKRKVLGG